MRQVSSNRKSGRNAAPKSQRRDTRKATRPPAKAAPHRASRRREPEPRESLAARLRAWAGRRFTIRRPVLYMSGALTVLMLIAALFAGGYVQAAQQRIEKTADAVSNYAGLSISKLHLSGENRTSPEVILAVLNLKPGQSIFDADLRMARARLMMLPWVADARVTRRYPDSISVDITEKTPFALWQSDHGLFVIERSGAVITRATVKEFPKLPVFVGGKPVGGGELTQAIASHRAIVARVTAMQRVSGRRWNLILDSGVVVKLPETGWKKQLDVLERLIVDKGVLERDIAEIDLRSKDNYFFVLRGDKQKQPIRGENKA